MRILTILCALLFTLATGATAGEAPLPTPTIPFTKYRLANGLEVILAPDTRLPIVAINIWYHVGAANETSDRTGFAHLFEHMMFTGSKHVPRGLAERLLEGAGGVDSNASTSLDRTNYFDTLPANQLELGLWVHADRMGYLLDSLDQKALSNQQDVVRNERRETGENRPYGIVDEAIYEALFPVGHPYRPDIIGSHADIQAARLADVRDFFKRYYRPNNATLVIAGDFDPAQAKRLVEKYFGSFKRGPDVPKPAVATPPITSERRITVTDRIELPRIDLAWLTPPAFAPGDAELDIAAEILAGGKSSRLYKRLVYDLQIAQGVGASQQSNALTSIFTIQALARPGHTPAELEAAIDAELARLAAEGPTQAEVDRARSTFEHQLFRGLEKVGGRANRLNLYNEATGDPGFLGKDLARYRSVTPDDVRRVVGSTLTKNSRVIAFAERGERKLPPDAPAQPVAASGPQAESINADEKWRYKAPGPGPQIVPHLPVPAVFKLGNGLTVYHLERVEPPVVSARLVVNAGLWANPPATPGLADFAVASLEDGTTSRSALEIADAFAQLGADFAAHTARDASVLQVNSLASRFPAAMTLLADVALHPTFPQAEIERARQSRLAAIGSEREDPGALADAAFRRALYGTDDAYGQTTLGTEASIRRIDGTMLKAFWQRWFRPENAALVVVGAVGAEEVRQLAEREWGGWSGTSAQEPAVAVAAPKSTTAKLVVVDLPGVNQTEVRVGRVAAARASPDFLALQLTNEILGGSFTSRLNDNLREKQGFAYGAFSRFEYGRSRGPFEVATSVRTDATAAAVREIRRELGRMETAPPGATEFGKARSGFIRSLPGAFETNAGIAGSFANLFVYRLPADYFAKLPAALDAVRLADVLRVSKQYLNPAGMVVVGVGARSAIAPPLEKLGLVPTEVLKPEELF